MFEQPDGGQCGLGGREDGDITVVVHGDTAVEVGCALWLDGRHGILCIVTDKYCINFTGVGPDRQQRGLLGIAWESKGVIGLGRMHEISPGKQTGMD